MSDVRILVLSPNWLGDSIMAMPALQALREEYVDAHISVMTKAHLADLWAMHDAPNDVLPFSQTALGTCRAIRQARSGAFDRAFVLPNSFRSAFIPFMAFVAERIGMPGHTRALLLSCVVHPPSDPRQRHQAWEYFAVMGLAPEATTDLLPKLRIPASAVSSLARLGLNADAPRRVALMPGAAHGESKRWPVRYFAELADALVEQHNAQIVLLGTHSEVEACAGIADRLAGNAVNLAGRTSIQELAAALRAADVTVANDSGGMHLSVAVGTPVVGIYGLTDPSRTGPLGRNSRIVSLDGVTRSRDISRRSTHATETLLAIRPETVLDAVSDILKAPSGR